MPAPSDDYYALLGVATDVDDEELRRTWRRLALQWHPDRAGPEATAMFQKLSIAYSVLSDSTARATYDKRRGITRRPPPPPPAEQPIGRRAPGVMLRRISGPLNILLARGVARQEPGDDVIELLLDAQEAAEGGMATISMHVPVRCECSTTASCVVCGGARTIYELYSAWLAVRPGVAEGTILKPSAQLPNMVKPVAFRVRLPA